MTAETNGPGRETSAAPCKVHPHRTQPCPLCLGFSAAPPAAPPEPDDLDELRAAYDKANRKAALRAPEPAADADAREEPTWGTRAWAAWKAEQDAAPDADAPILAALNSLHQNGPLFHSVQPLHRAIWNAAIEQQARELAEWKRAYESVQAACMKANEDCGRAERDLAAARAVIAAVDDVMDLADGLRVEGAYAQHGDRLADEYDKARTAYDAARAAIKGTK